MNCTITDGNQRLEASTRKPAARHPENPSSRRWALNPLDRSNETA
nr:hypothetical protein [Xenorhabdus beddingii]